MKLYIIRHAEPDYEHHTITERGKKEAAALGKRYNASDFDEIYCSPLERAQMTCAAVVKGKGKVHTVEWLRELNHYHAVLKGGKKQTCWDFKPEYINKHPTLLQPNFLESMEVRDGEFEKHLFHVWDSLDKLLAKHGYKREGYFYRVTKGNRDKIILFAHFGIMSAIVAHLMNIPFTNAAQFMICPPSGVTVFITEERTRGLAQFRMSRYGDTTHLGKEGIIRSFSGRFCELYTDKTRH